jgi:hypothetical protein
MTARLAGESALNHVLATTAQPECGRELYRQTNRPAHRAVTRKLVSRNVTRPF